MRQKMTGDQVRLIHMHWDLDWGNGIIRSPDRYWT